MAPLEVRGEFPERPEIHVALELDHHFRRNPVITPAPGIELGLARSPESHVAIATDQPQEIPDLLLAAIIAAPLAPDPPVGHIVAQPFARAPEDANVPRLQTYFFVQFAV